MKVAYDQTTEYVEETRCLKPAKEQSTNDDEFETSSI